MNRIFIQANFVDDPKTYTVRDTTKMVKFSLASNEYKSGREVTLWFDCTAFGKVAEQIEGYAKKGTKAVAIGRVDLNIYTNKEGQEVKKWCVIVDEISLIAKRKSQKDIDEFNAIMDNDETDIETTIDNSVPF